MFLDIIAHFSLVQSATGHQMAAFLKNAACTGSAALALSSFVVLFNFLCDFTALNGASLVRAYSIFENRAMDCRAAVVIQSWLHSLECRPCGTSEGEHSGFFDRRKGERG